MSDYPSGVYAPRSKSNKEGVVYNAEEATKIFAEDIVKLDDEVVAIENELGASPKGVAASVAERLENADAFNGVAVNGELFNNGFELELEENGGKLLNPASPSGFASDQNAEYKPKPCHISRIDVTLNGALVAGSKLFFVAKQDGVNLHTPIEFDAGGALTAGVDVDVDFTGAENIQYDFTRDDVYEYDLIPGTVTMDGENRGPSAWIPFIDDRLETLEAVKVTAIKLAQFAKTNSNVLGDVTGSSHVLKAGHHYHVQIFLCMWNYATADIQWKYNLGTVYQYMARRAGDAANAASPALNATFQNLVSSNQNVVEILDVFISQIQSDATGKLQFAQVTAQSNGCYIQNNSYIKITDLGLEV